MRHFGHSVSFNDTPPPRPHHFRTPGKNPRVKWQKLAHAASRMRCLLPALVLGVGEEATSWVPDPKHQLVKDSKRPLGKSQGRSAAILHHPQRCHWLWQLVSQQPAQKKKKSKIHQDREGNALPTHKCISKTNSNGPKYHQKSVTFIHQPSESPSPGNNI